MPDLASGVTIPPKGLEAALKPWERFDWSPEQRGRIYRDWGNNLSHKGQNRLAQKCFDNCLLINAHDATALYMRAQSKRKLADIMSAMDDALAAAAIDPMNPAISFAVTATLYDANEFEKCKAELHNNTRKYAVSVVKTLLEQIHVVDQNLSDSLGDSYSYFLLMKKELLEKIALNKKLQENKDVRPRWKILKEQDECDVLSIPEVKEELLSRRTMARRNRWLQKYYQTYFGRNWVDIEYLRNLIKKDDWGTTNAASTAPFLRKIAQPNYKIVAKLVKMLHARSPLYNELRRKFPDQKLYKIHKNNNLNYIQYNTRRYMCEVLRKLREFRQKGEIEKMSRYVEEAMSDTVAASTDRIMPWKFEFVNDVYNMLALTHKDWYTDTIKKIQENVLSRSNIRELFNIPFEVVDQKVKIEFGKNNNKTHLVGGLSSSQEAYYIKFLTHLEKRKIFAKYSIERVYLWHEISRTNFKLGRHEMCVTAAQKAIEETKNCNSFLWRFLSQMLIVKSYASSYKVEYCQKALEDAVLITKKLKDDKLTYFVELAYAFNDREINIRRKRHSGDSVRKQHRKSNLYGSFNSMESSVVGEDEFQKFQKF